MPLARLWGEEKGKMAMSRESTTFFSPIIFTVKYFQLFMPLGIYLEAFYVCAQFLSLIMLSKLS